jgi:hypothetical protein
MVCDALRYASEGLAVFPVYEIRDVDGERRCACGKEDCASPGKHPRTRNGVKDATTHEARIRAWWVQWPNANIGVATGRGRIVLDIDPRNGGWESLAELQEEYGPLPATKTAITGGGGRHFWFSGPSGVGGRVIRPGVDLKADGGYVVAPPSVHVSGGTYRWEWEVDGREQDDIEPAPLPDWVLPLAGRPGPSANGGSHGSNGSTPGQAKSWEPDPNYDGVSAPEELAQLELSGRRIPVGGRHEFLGRQAASFWGASEGLAAQDLRDFLDGVNETFCEDPGSSEADVAGWVKWFAQRPAGGIRPASEAFEEGERAQRQNEVEKAQEAAAKAGEMEARARELADRAAQRAEEAAQRAEKAKIKADEKAKEAKDEEEIAELLISAQGDRERAIELARKLSGLPIDRVIQFGRDEPRFILEISGVKYPVGSDLTSQAEVCRALTNVFGGQALRIRWLPRKRWRALATAFVNARELLHDPSQQIEIRVCEAIVDDINESALGWFPPIDRPMDYAEVKDGRCFVRRDQVWVHSRWLSTELHIAPSHAIGVLKSLGFRKHPAGARGSKGEPPVSRPYWTMEKEKFQQIHGLMIELSPE